jgi:selenocysteine lyase/cysteine desulfurase
MIYLDNAATSFPKPEHCLRRGLAEYLALGASPGRGGYDAAVEAGRALAAVREALAAFCGAEGYAVCLGQNATDALNTALLGLVPPEGHVVATRLEHNSVPSSAKGAISRNGCWSLVGAQNAPWCRWCWSATCGAYPRGGWTGWCGALA